MSEKSYDEIKIFLRELEHTILAEFDENQEKEFKEIDLGRKNVYGYCKMYAWAKLHAVYAMMDFLKIRHG